MTKTDIDTFIATLIDETSSALGRQDLADLIAAIELHDHFRAQLREHDEALGRVDISARQMRRRLAA